MRAYRLNAFGGMEGLSLGERDLPGLGRHDIRVRVRAASLNYRDVMILEGRYAFAAPAGITPLSDGAGEVIAVGAGVTRFAPGDRVAGVYFQRWIDGRLTPELAREQFGCTHEGMLAEYAVADESSWVTLPRHLSFEEGATLPCAALTAWSALTGGARPVLAGETVLVLGTGGVALFGLQFAKLFGARVIAVTSRIERGEQLRALGAYTVIDSKATPDWDVAVRAATEGRGVDHVLESIGPDTLERSIKSAAFDAQLALVGAFSSPGITLDPRLFGGRLISIHRVAVGSRAGFEAMNRAITHHRLQPVIDRVFDFDDAKQAYVYFQASHHMGKVVIAGASS
ncbi:zinc-dependent alcohol dehydrogenase family protein [Pinirhizobacter soli]|uniref:zinc-dependent alcohol dehydrogenase family protein n=1 Tax=Pinirhizobacter soli TaxID=2786953 RepID=UPI00202A9134|nr:NAD(P)-dependent alcohol dehydrogenase [Pinirhizobacter soli]